MKPGWKTTEFWATIALNLGALTAASAHVLPPKWAAIAAAASVVAYNVSRGLAKTGATK